jgi:lia operon protein LiaF
LAIGRQFSSYGFVYKDAAVDQGEQEVDGMDDKQLRFRNTAYLLIGAGVFLLLQHWLGFFNLAAAMLVGLGVYRIRTVGDRRGYVVAAIGAVVLATTHFNVLVMIVLFSLAVFYLQSRKVRSQDGMFTHNHKLIASLKLDQEPWVLRSMGWWSLVGELRLDLSLALPEQEETTIVLQGLIGDVDIKAPAEDLGVWVTASVLVGQIQVPDNNQAGVLSKAEWRSPNYETCDRKVKIVISYLVGDIDIVVW